MLGDGILQQSSRRVRQDDGNRRTNDEISGQRCEREKAVDRIIEIEGQFDGRNITKFLDSYKREMNQKDVSKAR